MRSDPAAPPSASQLVTFARDELLSSVTRAQRCVRLASPFLSEDVARVLASQARAGRSRDWRLLCALTERSVISGVLSAHGLMLLLNAGWHIRSITNLHAKVALVDRSWGLVGSGNLTGAGFGAAGARAGNVELGVRLGRGQIRDGINIFDGWWNHSAAADVTADVLKPFLQLEKAPGLRGTGARVGRAIPLPATRAVAQRRLTSSTELWAKAMYHRDPTRGEWWMSQTWIHDRYGTRPDGTIKRRPGYQPGDRIVLYLVEPQRCPAIYVVTGLPEDGRERVRRAYGDEEAALYGWVTPVEVLAAVPLDRAPGIGSLGLVPQSLQNGFVRIRNRPAYARLEQRLRR